jgi:hypothetical protein
MDRFIEFLPSYFFRKKFFFIVQIDTNPFLQLMEICALCSTGFIPDGISHTPLRNTCPTYLIPFDWIMLIISGSGRRSKPYVWRDVNVCEPLNQPQCKNRSINNSTTEMRFC